MGEHKPPARVQGLLRSSQEDVYTEDATSFIARQSPAGLVRPSDGRHGRQMWTGPSVWVREGSSFPSERHGASLGARLVRSGVCLSSLSSLGLGA